MAGSGVKTCPRPDKIRYYGVEQANHAARTLDRDGRVGRPYQCRCGAWHISGAERRRYDRECRECGAEFTTTVDSRSKWGTVCTPCLRVMGCL